MLHGADGQNTNKMTWEQFTKFQRWDEFLERSENPPMTVDFMFWKDEQKYYCTGEDHGFVIVDADWNRLAYDKNFLKLLETPLWDGRSFKDVINDLLFAD